MSDVNLNMNYTIIIRAYVYFMAWIYNARYKISYGRASRNLETAR